MSGVLNAVKDRSAVRWVSDALQPRGPGLPTVGEFVPGGHAGYARLLHPAFTQEEEPVTWSRVAEWSGRQLHPTVLYEDLSTREGGEGAPFSSPAEGQLPPSICARLAPLLAGATSAPEVSWYCVWAGWGGIQREKRPIKIRKGWEYLLYRGPVAAVTRLELEVEANLLYRVAEGGGDRPRVRRRPPKLRELAFYSPSLWWPEDRAWFLATEIEAASTYIGGSAELIDQLVADPELEVLPARLDDPFDGVHPGMRSSD